MTTAPFVELRFNPTDLRPGDLPRAGAYLGSPSEALEAALAVARAAMVERVKLEIASIGAPSQAQMLRVADLAWQAVFWKYRKVSAPIIADAYLRAYMAADAGDVPTSVIYSLADQHAEKIGEYFYTSSREALAEGYTTLVNRRVPAKAAADRVLDAYGLTPRQMRAYTAASTFDTPISSKVPRPLKAKARAFIDKAFTGRVRKLSAQEEHNIDEQAKQYAWMWLQDHGRLNKRAQKLWITAKDERVCKVCGPLHGRRVGINERFHTSEGDFWTPGMHPNCRCVVRLLEHRFSKSQFAKAQKWDAKRHPRGGDPENPGRFSAVARHRDTTTGELKPFKERERPVFRGLFPILEEETEKVSMGEPPGGGISMGGGGISMGGVEMGGGVSMGEEGKVSMGEGKVSMTDAEEESKKVSLGEPKGIVRMSEEEAREKIAMEVTPGMRVKMDAAVAQALEFEVEQFVPAPPRKRRLFVRPIRQIKSDTGKPYAVYAIGNPVDSPVMAGGKLTNLNRDLVFTTDKSKMIAQAEVDFTESIIRANDYVIDSDLHRFSQTTGSGEDKVQWTADMEEEDVLGVITWKAYQGRVPDSDWSGGDPLYEVVWRGPRGEERIEERHASQLADMMNVHSEDFEVRLLRLTEGHDSELGSTEQVTHKGSGDNWVTEGDYRMKKTRHPEDSHTLRLNVYNLDPDVEEIEVPSIFDD